MDARLLVNPIDWNLWRAEYDNLTFADQQEFYRWVAMLHPRQRAFNMFDAERAFKIIGPGATVAELGGWDGKLADQFIEWFEIPLWRNYDLVVVPQRCHEHAYQHVLLTDHIWNRPRIEADLFLATHTIEHFRFDDLWRIFNHLDVTWIYLEAPLRAGPTDWTHYPGSHILEVGWDIIDQELASLGWEWASDDRDIHLYRRGR